MDDHVHVMPLRVLFGVFFALLVLTVLTVAVTWVDLGSFNLLIALGVAVVKASLVALYFMHLRYDKPFNALVLIGTLLFVALFIAFALLDTQASAPGVIPGYQPAMDARAAERAGQD
jgi:cytochrome c oxidase subunit 4